MHLILAAPSAAKRRDEHMTTAAVIQHLYLALSVLYCRGRLSAYVAMKRRLQDVLTRLELRSTL